MHKHWAYSVREFVLFKKERNQWCNNNQTSNRLAEKQHLQQNHYKSRWHQLQHPQHSAVPFTKYLKDLYLQHLADNLIQSDLPKVL